MYRVVFPDLRYPFSLLICLALYSFQGANGGDNEIRTHDPLLARQVLSQLSYTPTLYLSFSQSSAPANLLALNPEN